MMERTFNRKEVEEMCTQSYMRGMMVQFEMQNNVKQRTPRKVFSEWLKELIDELPTEKFKENENEI